MINKNITKFVVSIVMVGVVAFAMFLYVSEDEILANPDYICTKVLEEEDSRCSNGSWGNWVTVSDTDVETVSERIYTGYRTIRTTIQYANLRTSCQSGYTQTRNGDAGGASGFHGGERITEGTACQLKETRTEIKDGANNGDNGDGSGNGSGAGNGSGNGNGGGNGSGAGNGSGNEVVVDIVETDTGETIVEREDINSVGELDTVFVSDFTCSLDRLNWNDCTDVIRLTSYDQPIYIKTGNIDHLVSQTFSIVGQNSSPVVTVKQNSDGLNYLSLEETNNSDIFLRQLRTDVVTGTGSNFKEQEIRIKVLNVQSSEI